MISCRKFFLSRSPEKLRCGTLLFFRVFPVSRKFMDRRGEGRNHDLLSEIFCRTVPEKFIGEPFSVSETFRYR